jgi:hypothetical protein
MRRLLTVLAALTITAGITLAAAPAASAHDDICDLYAGYVCDARQSVDLSYIQADIEWCRTPAGYTAARLAHLTNRFVGASKKSFRLDVVRSQPNFTLLATSVDFTLFYGDTATFDFTGALYEPNSHNVYLIIRMHNGAGNPDTIWRLAPGHWRFHGDPYEDTTRYVSAIGTWNC